MSWLIIIELLMKIFGPFLSDVLKKLFDKLFKNAEANLKDQDPSAMSSKEAIDKLFNEVQQKLPKFGIARRLLLRRMRSVAQKHSEAIVNNQEVILDIDDREELQLIGTLSQ